MPRRRELKGIAAGIAGSFTSRNNDLEGYWALGKLYALVDSEGGCTFEVDLGSGHAMPAKRQARILSKRFTDRLRRLLENRRLDDRLVASAVIRLNFGIDETEAHRSAYRTRGKPYQCEVLLTDDRGKTWSHVVYGWCAPHDPSKELKNNSPHGS